MFQRIIPRVCSKNMVFSLKHPRWMSSTWRKIWLPVVSHRQHHPSDVSEPFFIRLPDYYIDEHNGRPVKIAKARIKSSAAEAGLKSVAAALDKVKYGSNKLEIKLDVSLYAPEELNVLISSEDRLIIKGKHEQKEDDYGYIAREFTREIIIPECIEQASITSTLSDDGMLIIQGRVKGGLEAKGRVINIERQKKDK